MVVFIVATMMLLGVGLASYSGGTEDEKEEPELVAEVEEPELEPEPESEPEPEEPKVTDFQNVINSWVWSLKGAKVAVMMYDLDNDVYVGKVNADTSFDSASLYKLVVAYAGYLMREKGEIKGDMYLTGGRTINECLDAAVRSSNSACGEALRRYIGAEKLSEFLTKWGMESTDLYNIRTTAGDMVALLKVMYKHEGLSTKTWAEIQDSMLNQPKSEGLCGEEKICNWRAGLPSGFSSGVKVYDKVGWLSKDGESWELYHDVAILEFPSGQHYAIAVLTSDATLVQIRDLAKKIEQGVK